MSWRDTLLPARYRDADFFVDSAESVVGRRTVLHEYPLRDLPFVEDLGRKARTFTIEAYVLATRDNGFDYTPARDLLLAQIEKKGKGALVHPYLGEMQMVVTEAKLHESTAEGGMARFTLTCVEAGAQQFPEAGSDTESLVGDAADAGGLAVEADFAENFTVENRPAFVSSAAIDVLNGAVAAVQAAVNAIPTASGPLSDFLPRIANMSNQLATLIRTPSVLAATFVGLLNDIGNIVNAPRDALNGLRQLFNHGATLPAVTATTPSTTQQAANQAAIVAMVRRAAHVEAARVSAEIEFDSFQDADAVRTELAEGLDELMLDADDIAFQALAEVRSAMIRDITARGADLARLVEYTPQATLPALAIAYELYEDPLRDAEIVARNRGKAALLGLAKPTFLRLPERDLDFASTPDSAALSFPGDRELEFGVALDGLAGNHLVAIKTATFQDGFWCWILNEKLIRFQWGDGSATPHFVDSEGKWPFAAGALGFGKIKVIVDDGADASRFEFFISGDRLTWKKLGDTVTAAVAVIADNTAAQRFGFPGLFKGNLFYWGLRNGIDGPLVANFDPLDGQIGDTSFTSKKTSEVWTINQSPDEPKARLAGLLALASAEIPSGIRHPGFVLGGRAIEVLADA